jgi:hypothetical protein
VRRGASKQPRRILWEQSRLMLRKDELIRAVKWERTQEETSGDESRVVIRSGHSAECSSPVVPRYT